MLEPFDLINILIFILGVGMVLYTTRETIIRPKKWLTIFPLLFWAAHLTIFYATIVISHATGSPLSDDAQLVWGTVQRLHGVITMFYMTWIVANSDMRCKNG